MIDTHCHIDDEAFAADRQQVLMDQKEANVQAIIVPGVGLSSVYSVMAVCDNNPNYCYPALGLHPEEIKADWEQQWIQIEQAIRTYRNKLVAIGEIGLDYYWDKTYKTEQQEVLRLHLLLARELNLPVIIHNRESTEDILRIVTSVAQQPGQTPLRGVFHCFNGSAETAQQIAKLGFYIGIGGVLTFKNCKLRDHLQAVPLERIVLETDAPYMAPVPHRGKRNESKWMSCVAEHLAQVYNCSVEQIENITTTNARKLFGI